MQKDRQTVLSSNQVGRILDRLACEIIERNKGHESIELVGIEKTGVDLAKALSERLNKILGVQIDYLSLDTRPYRDDQPSLNESELPAPLKRDMTDRNVVLVDDVLFTGRTVRAALDAIVHCGRPRSIQLLVLIDRGNREFPIAPTFTGRVIPTKANESIIVDTSADLEVYLVE